MAFPHQGDIQLIGINEASYFLSLMENDTILLLTVLLTMSLFVILVYAMCRRIHRQLDNIELLTSIRSENLRKEVEKVVKEQE